MRQAYAMDSSALFKVFDVYGYVAMLLVILFVPPLTTLFEVAFDCLMGDTNSFRRYARFCDELFTTIVAETLNLGQYDFGFVGARIGVRRIVHRNYLPELHSLLPR